MINNYFINIMSTQNTLKISGIFKDYTPPTMKDFLHTKTSIVFDRRVHFVLLVFDEPGERNAHIKHTSHATPFDKMIIEKMGNYSSVTKDTFGKG